jgi:predicted GNAT superfamily acetyltransferase
MTTARPQEALPATPAVQEAHLQADQAAVRAGVLVTLVNDLSGLEAVEELINRTWDNDTSEISLGVLRAFSKSGNFVSGAFRDDRLVGACVAFVSGGEEPYLHSHLAAVSPDHRARGVGFALKLHQRAWALGRGIPWVSWTFDPLVRRNARLNVARLGASPVEYLPDFYGTRPDSLNLNVPTDRMLVLWTLDSAKTALACTRRATPLDAAQLAECGSRVLVSPDGADEPATQPDTGAPTVLVGLPKDITVIRRDRPEVAERWRTVVRRTLGRAIDHGIPVVGFTEQGHYVIDRTGFAPVSLDAEVSL